MIWPFKKKQLSVQAQRQKDLETIGKQVMVLYDHVNPDRKGLYRTAFLKGLVTGLGSVIGATIIVALLAWMLSLFHHIPFVNQITDNAQNSIESR
jgi:hypothetical protein